MGRRAAKVDDNQAEVVKDLRKLGVTVQHLHTVGMGCPDILCGYRGRNFLVEIKDGAKVPSARKLTLMEERWHEQWRGQVMIGETAEEIFAAIQEEITDNWRQIGDVARDMVQGVVK